MQIKDYPLITALSDDDLLLVQTANDSAYKCITKANLFSGYSSTGGSTPTTPPTATDYPTGMKLWLEGGSLLDKSGNANHATPVGSSSPTVITSTSGKPALKWNGSGTQELQVTPFLQGTNGATLYCVFTASDGNYNLARTSGLDDYWRFVSGPGYFGTFRGGRIDNYPAVMPNSGSHLISVHAETGYYEVMLDNVSQGTQVGTFTPGDRFRIGTNDKAFGGDISLLLVYPNFIGKTFKDHLDCISAIKSKYPTLTIS
ncbi:hypothetical protein [Nostoc sp.]|uniref:hypothetical protein n=1 Tax=Nostoc sp. TaxID=1180 RepID=UPI002FF4D9AE